MSGGRGRRWGRGVGLVVVVLLAVGAAWWAGRTTARSALPEATPVAQPVLATAVSGKVGRSLPVAVTVTRGARLVATNQLSGVVSQVNGGETAVGDVLYTAGGVSARAVVADEPFFRDLVQGVRGKDVRALQEFLVSRGHLEPDAVDGVFGPSTRVGVQAWQRKLGVTVTGTVGLGELVAFPQLPTTVMLDEQIVAGASVTAGAGQIRAATGVVEFTLVVSEDQATQYPADASVEVRFEGTTWLARITGSTPREGGVVLALEGADGGPVCGQECDLLGEQQTSSLSGAVVVQPPVEGITVPAAAVLTSVEGTTEVVMADGERREVRVLGSGQGVVVVEGVSDGEQVRLTQPGSTDDTDDGQ